MVILLMAIDDYLLMAIGGYYINGYYINGYWWLLVVVGGCWWLFY